MEFFTIGVYNTTQEEFFQKLLDNRIDTFCDIRQRRGVRGSKYSFVNSNRLQEKLNDLEIKYGYIQGLAPSTEIRDLQKKADAANMELKSERQHLGSTFVSEYKNQILTKFDFETFFENLENIGANKVVLFCVEEKAEACHRHLVTDELSSRFNFKITHL